MYLTKNYRKMALFWEKMYGEIWSVLLEFFAMHKVWFLILHSNCSDHFMFTFVLISLFHPSRKICHLYLTYCVVVSVSGSCSTKCFWLCPLFHFPWKQLSHSKSPRVPRSHLTHQGTILAALRTFTWSFIVL